MKHLERDPAAEPRVLGQIHIAHPARSEVVDYAVRSETVARFNWPLIGEEEVRRNLRHVRIQQTVAFVGAQQRLDLAAERVIAGALRSNEPFAPGRWLRECGVQEIVDLAPALDVHRPPASVRFPVSRCSQALAVVQSRITVTAETPRMCAVSSTLRPPKNRSSTTCDFR